MKTTIKYRIREVKTKVPKRVVERRNLPRFGDAKSGEENVTLLSKDFVAMDHPDEQLNEDGADDPTLKNTLQSFVMKQQERAIHRELDSSPDDEVEEFVSDGLTGNPTPGSYVPPAQRGRGGATTTATSSLSALGQANTDDNTLRVSNLTKNVTEDDLRDLFEPFGRVQRVYLPRVERVEGSRTFKEPKGFAFIAFLRKDDAELAINKLNGHGYDHLILKVEWAKPNKDGGGGGGGGGLSGGYVSGYGKQLAQDTKEKVSYASNLTGNK